MIYISNIARQKSVLTGPYPVSENAGRELDTAEPKVGGLEGAYNLTKKLLMFFVQNVISRLEKCEGQTTYCSETYGLS